jgi:hypothetical protein
MSTLTSTVTIAIQQIGLTRLSKRFGFYPSAVQKWRDRGRLPKTELAGLTNYAQVIAELSRDTDEPVTMEELLMDTRKGWQKRAEELRKAS